MNQRLFQDAGGTTPAIIAGQPVGLIRRLAGSGDALQATALSKPTLARWPKSGVRNLAMGAQAVGNSAHWANTNASSGVTVTKIGHGIEGGIPYVDVSFLGTSVGTTLVALFVAGPSRIPRLAGRLSAAKVSGRLLAGSLPTTAGTKGLRAEIIETTESGSYSTGSSSPSITTKEEQTVSVVRAEGDNPASINTGGRVVVTVAPGDEVDFSYRVKGFQWELGDAHTPLQFNYGPNDITEMGVPDLWHLYNDGGDSLNVTLPTGTYGLASIDINREITVTTITSDGTTPINTLRHERQLDVILRAGAFSAGEETAIRDYWGRVFA